MDDGRGSPNGGALRASVLVLNKLYMAVRVVSARRAFTLLYKRDAEALDTDDGRIAAFDFPAWIDHSGARAAANGHGTEFVRTPRHRLLVPRVIRLVDYADMPRRQVRFSRRSVLARDGHRCQYCGRQLPAGLLSLDHVVPRSLGGGSTWTNIVAACNACNTRKGGRSPQQAGMRLLRPPVAPRRNPLIALRLQQEKYSLWRLFLDEASLAVEA